MSSHDRYVALLVAIVALAISDGATAQHFDIFISRPAAGTKTIVGGADVGSATYDDTTRVFEVELGTVAGEYLALEPGANHPNLNDPVTAYPSSAAGLQPGDELLLEEQDFSVNSNVDDLFYWNGTGHVSFSPATADFRMDGSDPLGSTAGLGGAFDDHPFLVVDSAAIPGVYLASLRGTVVGIDPSEPIYLVMGSEDLITAEFLEISDSEFTALSEDELDEALEAVIETAATYVESNLVVPEPASLVIVAAAGCCLAGYRLRRKGN
jgi:hypothetical protein